MRFLPWIENRGDTIPRRFRLNEPIAERIISSAKVPGTQPGGRKDIVRPTGMRVGCPTCRSFRNEFDLYSERKDYLYLGMTPNLEKSSIPPFE